MRWLMLALLIFVRVAMGYQFQSVASVSSQLVATFGLSFAQIGTLIGFFLLPGMFMAIPSGAMTRAATDKTLVMIGAAVMVAGAVLMAIAETSTPLYAGRLLTGVGGTIFNLMLAKMVTDWFFGKELITALGVLLVAWPIGIALALLTQGAIARAFGWSSVMIVCALVALVSLAMTALAYRGPPQHASAASAGPLRFGLPIREAVHISVVGIVWTLYNACWILLPSFGPDALVARGWSVDGARSTTSLMMWASLASLPLGGRLIEKFGYVTPAIIAFLLVTAACIALLFFGIAPSAMLVLCGLAAGVPGGALLALTSEALAPANRGPGLGIFYTWYYAGMAIAPAVAGWLRDAVGHAGAPLMLAAALTLACVFGVASLRALQARWPVQQANAPA